MGLFDKFLGKSTPIENVSIQRLVPRIQKNKTDLILLSTSRTCPFCSSFNGKVYSLYGWNKRYPKIPKEMLNRYCPNCKKIMGAGMYFEGISTPPKKN